MSRLPAYTTVQYTVASDGTPIFACKYKPTTVPAPAVILIHGGGWSQGSRLQYASEAQYIQSAGYIVFSIDYRFDGFQGLPLLQGQPAPVYYPAQVNDCTDAVEYLTTDTDCNGKIGALGGSAGGTLALMLGFANPTIKCAAALSPMTDASDPTGNNNAPFYFTSAVECYCNATDTETLRADSPVASINNLSKPTLSFFGQNDLLPTGQQPLLKTALDAQGLTNYTLWTVPNGGHSFSYWNYAVSGQTVAQRVVAFFGTYLH